MDGEYRSNAECSENGTCCAEGRCWERATCYENGTCCGDGYCWGSQSWEGMGQRWGQAASAAAAESTPGLDAISASAAVLGLVLLLRRRV